MADAVGDVWQRTDTRQGCVSEPAAQSPVDAETPQEPLHDELQPSLPQVEEPRQGFRPHGGQRAVGERYHLHRT